MSNLNSYVAASKFPWKLLQQKEKIIRFQDNIVPYHIQFIPTNRCNAKCPWCSCNRVDRSVELGIDEVKEMLSYFASLGTKAITITGGGEPSIYPDIEKVINTCYNLGLKVGIVTNGLKWSKENEDISYLNGKATWLRLSVVNTVGDYDTSMITRLCNKIKDVDVGISFTVVPGVNIDTAQAICNIAKNTKNITHVRFVQDILNPNDVSMNDLKSHCQNITNKAIYQYRSDFSKGTDKCLISLLKPVIDATGYIYPCCGVQYASNDTRRMPENFRMCYWRDFHKVKHFDGNQCIKCYYEDYNSSLQNLTNPLEHKEFI